MTTFQAQPVTIDTYHAILHLTTVSQQCRMSTRLANKENHDSGRNKTVYLCTGMDTTGEDQTERNAVSLSSSQDARKNYLALYRRGFQVTRSERAGDTSQAKQAIEKAGTRPAYNSRRPSRLQSLIDGP